MTFVHRLEFKAIFGATADQGSTGFHLKSVTMPTHMTQIVSSISFQLIQIDVVTYHVPCSEDDRPRPDMATSAAPSAVQFVSTEFKVLHSPPPKYRSRVRKYMYV